MPTIKMPNQQVVKAWKTKQGAVKAAEKILHETDIEQVMNGYFEWFYIIKVKIDCMSGWSYLLKNGTIG